MTEKNHVISLRNKMRKEGCEINTYKKSGWSSRFLAKRCNVTISAVFMNLLAVSLNIACTNVSQASLFFLDTKIRIQEKYNKLPLSFEANRGQTDNQVKFLSRGAGYTLFLTPTEAILSLNKINGTGSNSNLGISEKRTEKASVCDVIRMKLVGANTSSRILGLQQQPGVTNYFIGSDPKQWHTNVPSYSQVHYSNVYPGIDLVYYGNQRQLEYDFVVAPGVNPKTIALEFDGVKNFKIDAHGNLVLRTNGGYLYKHKPKIYQEEDGSKREITGKYVLKGHHQVGFQVASYDKNKTLIIDPVLSYSTYLGGSNNEIGKSIAVDSQHNMYVTGWTNSVNFPTANPLQSTNMGGATYADAYVVKLDPTGSALIYATYLGGGGTEYGDDIAVDASGNAYVSGYTASSDFPTANPFQSTFRGGSMDAFVTKLNSTGTALLYSTYLGGSGDETARSIAVDASGNAYVTGETISANFPLANPLQSVKSAGHDVFVTKFNATGSALVYSTYLGGNSTDGASAIAIDSSGNAYITGQTNSTNFPTVNPLQPQKSAGYHDAFVAKLNASGNALVYSTYLGGEDYRPGGFIEQGEGIAVDSLGNAYVIGDALSLTFPLSNPLQATFGGGNVDGFVAKLDPTGSTLIYSTYLGGTGDDVGTAIAVNNSGNAHVTGWTRSNNFPVVNPVINTNSSTMHAFVTKFHPSGTSLVYSTCLGSYGSASGGLGIALDEAGSAYIAGRTNSTIFPTVNPLQSANAGSDDVFIAKISDNVAPVAHAGIDQTVDEGALVTLDGTGSSDPNGDTLTYQWVQVAGPSVSLNLANPAQPTFQAPNVPTGGLVLTFQLTVSDGQLTSVPDAVDIVVKNVNHPPVADAGIDQTVQEGSPVTLDGSGSFDQDGDTLSYTWVQVGGTPVAIQNPSAVQISFTAPIINTSGEMLTFVLTVNDGSDAASDEITVYVENVNHVPVANAGIDQTRNENSVVTLDGTGSSDPDGDSLTYSWIQVAGTLVTLSNATSGTPTFTAPIVGSGGAILTFQLTVHDGFLSSTPDEVTVTILNTNDPPACNLAQASQTSIWPPDHKMVQIGIVGITDPDNDQVTITITGVTQDEPVNGLGDGDTSPDAVIQDDKVLLRAERAGNGNGRVYTVHFTADDGASGPCAGSVKVSVPHNRKSAAVDDGYEYDSTLP